MQLECELEVQEYCYVFCLVSALTFLLPVKRMSLKQLLVILNMTTQAI